MTGSQIVNCLKRGNPIRVEGMIVYCGSSGGEKGGVGAVRRRA
jgi:hypothetical protein